MRKHCTNGLAAIAKALSVEAERGFNDLMGNQYRFSEFLSLSLNQPPAELPLAEQEKLRAIAARFDSYSDLSFAQRQHLVADTRRTLYQVRRELEGSGDQGLRNGEEGSEGGSQNSNSSGSGISQATQTKTKLPRTAPLVESRTKIELDQAITYLPGIGAKNSERLAKLGIFTVRDLLYYYPRDHINYARQVNIRDAAEGETVTLVGTVKRCTCFNSPRNAKLTIFELIVRDHTGQIKLSKFFAGTRYRNRGWQEQQKRMYPPSAVVAASGLVKKNKYGVTLDDPQIEVIDHAGSSIESMKVGRVVPVYTLTEGVAADLVRRAVVAAIPAAANLQDPLPEALREKYGLIGVQERSPTSTSPPAVKLWTLPVAVSSLTNSFTCNWGCSNAE